MTDAKDQVAAPAKPAAGSSMTKTIGSETMMTSAETSAAALAANVKAMVEARFAMAKRFPRDWDEVRSKMLAACERPGFSGEFKDQAKNWGAGWFRKPIGDGVEGFSVRFAEEAQRSMGNIDDQSYTVWDDPSKRIIQVIVLDLENNNSEQATVVVEKTVERSKTRDGLPPLKVRKNSFGNDVFTVEATDDEVLGKQNALVSKTRRNLILRFLPGDIQAACRSRMMDIRNGDIAKDPGKAKRDVIDAFGKLNITPAMLKKILGHDISIATPAEIARLRDTWKMLNDGEATWADVLEALDLDPDDPEAPKKPASEILKEKLAAKADAAEPVQGKEDVTEQAGEILTDGDPVCACTEPKGKVGESCEACTLKITERKTAPAAAKKTAPAKMVKG